MPLGAIAQLGERLICIQEVVGSIPSGSTIFSACRAFDGRGACPEKIWIELVPGFCPFPSGSSFCLCMLCAGLFHHIVKRRFVRMPGPSWVLACDIGAPPRYHMFVSPDRARPGRSRETGLSRPCQFELAWPEVLCRWRREMAIGNENDQVS